MEFTQPQKNPYAVMDLYSNNNCGWDMFYIYKIYIVVQNAGNGLNHKHTYRYNSDECKDLNRCHNLLILHFTDHGDVWENKTQLL